MGKTSSKVKEKYNKKAYDDVKMRVRKGQKEVLEARAKELGKTINGYIIDLIRTDIPGFNDKKDE